MTRVTSLQAHRRGIRRLLGDDLVITRFDPNASFGQVGLYALF